MPPLSKPAKLAAPKGKKTTKPKKGTTVSKVAKKPATKTIPVAPLTDADWNRLQPVFEDLVTQYKTPAYVPNDPIQIPYQYIDDPSDCELAGFITALFSYGRRDTIIETMKRLFTILGPSPTRFLESFDPKKDAKLFQHFIYRFNKGVDVVFLLSRLQWAYDTYGSLESLFQAGMHPLTQNPMAHAPSLLFPSAPLQQGIAAFTEALLGETPLDTYGTRFLLSHPDRGGACKRVNMFLRWMVRHDPEPSERVDFGLWQTALTPADLLIPLDTHILKMNGHLALSQRNDSTWRTAEDVTQVFRRLCPEDPIRYDYALFGFSLDGRKKEEILSLLTL